MEAKAIRVEVVHNPPQPPCIWVQTMLDESLNDFIALKGQILNGYVLTLKKTKKVSRNAHNYMWKLCEKMAEKMRTTTKDSQFTKYDVYRHAIRSVGDWVDQPCRKEDFEYMKNGWEKRGDGWIAEIIYDYGEMVDVRYYQGCSEYTAEQKRRLINFVVDSAKEMGIETETPVEIERLINLWQTTGL